MSLLRQGQIRFDHPTLTSLKRSSEFVLPLLRQLVETVDLISFVEV